MKKTRVQVVKDVRLEFNVNGNQESMKALFNVALALAISGCGSVPFVVEGEPKYDPALHARIRVLDTVTLYAGEACESFVPAFGKVIVGKTEGIHIPAGSRFYENKKLGMPVATTRQLPARYHEVIAEGGKHLSLSGITGHDNARCGPVGAKMVPQAGKDYEVRFYSYWEGNKERCRLDVDQLVANGTQLATVPIQLEPLESTSMFGSNPKCGSAGVK